ncbi:penicillin-binding protein 2 [Bacteriovoracaceae bacterium]|nr:penicillin-binding protein 2 [Bacteriovoracaceae bacterium]
MFGGEELVRAHKSRATAVANIIILSFAIIFLRLWYLQVIKGEHLHSYSVKNRLRREIVRAPRGMVFSRDGKLLVNNTPRFDAVLTRQYLINPKVTLARLAKILKMPPKRVKRIIKKHSSQAKYRPIIIKKNISREEVAVIETNNAELAGVSVETFISRKYKDTEVGAHLLGYISEINQNQLPKYTRRDNYEYRLGDFIGQFGLEQQMDKTLRGVNGFEYVEVDAFGRKKRYISKDNLFKGIKNQPSVPGKNIKLTIDHNMQLAGAQALTGKTGSVVAIDISTGQILTMVSSPAFDPAVFSKGLSSKYWNSLRNNPNKPMYDKAIQNHYSPGSTFKPFTAIAGLEEGLIDGNSKIRCHGTFKLGRRVYHSWKKYGTKKVDVRNALQQSCNIFFYTLGSKLDIDVLGKYARMFGLGEKTGVGLPREVSGLIPSKEWKLKLKGEVWQQGETLSCSIGQSYILASILQMANAYAAIASEGKLYRPYLVKEIFDNSGKVLEKFEPELIRDIKLKPSTFKLVKEGLYRVVNTPKGTAWWRRGRGNQMAGKTGTSQVVSQAADKLYKKCEEAEEKFRHHGLFVAFAPFDNPKIAVASLVEHGCHGSSAAAPVVEKVISTYMKKYMPEKQQEYAKQEQKEYLTWLRDRNKKRAAALKVKEAESEQPEG